jgi:hypothetical protein
VFDGADVSFRLWSLLQLDSPQAIILLMLGGAVWVFASLKGYAGFDDPYPEFGAMDRAARRAADALSEEREAAHEAMEEPLDAAREAIGAQAAKTRDVLAQMNAAFDAAGLELEALNGAEAQLDALEEAAVRVYREENLAARTTPAPAHFSLWPRGGVASDPLAGAAAMIEAARANAQDTQKRGAAALAGLAEALEAAVRRLDGAASQ